MSQPLDPRIAFLQQLLPTTLGAPVTPTPAPVAQPSAQITPQTRQAVNTNTNAAVAAAAASPAGQFVKGFTGNPGTDYGNSNPAANFGDAVANATPAGGMASGAEHLPALATQAAHGLPSVIEHATPAMSAMVMGGMNIVKKGAKAAEDVASKVPMITKTKADPKAVANYLSVFDIPRRIAQNMQVKPETVIHQLVDDGITNVKSLNDLEAHAKNITGETGAFPQINNYILKQIKQSVNYDDALASIKTLESDVLEGEKPGFVNEVMNEVRKAFEPVNYLHGDTRLGLTGSGNASDLFQVSQNLRNIQRMYLRKSATDMGELSHPEMDRAARALSEIKNNVDDAIDAVVSPQDYQSFKNDPFVLEQLKRVPPKVADRWMKGATRFKDGQTIQAPYVNLSNMIEDTKDTQMSAWTKAAKAMQQQNVSGGVGQVIRENVPGPKFMKNAVGSAAENLAKPFDKSPEDIMSEATSGQAPGAKPKGKGNKGLVIGTALGGAGIAGLTSALESSKEKSNAEGNQQTDFGYYDHNNNVSSSPVDVKDIPQNQTDIKVDSPVPHPSNIKGSNGSLAISDDQYNNTITQLQALKADPAYQVFPKSQELDAAIAAVTNKHTQSGPLLDKYEKVTAIDQKVADAKQLLSETSPNAWNALPGIGGITQGLQSSFDPKYKQLMTDFSYIENVYPGLKGSLTNLGSKESADAALDQARKIIRADYYNEVHRFAGSETAGQPAAQAPQATGLPPIGSAPIGGGNSGGGSVQGSPLSNF